MREEEVIARELVAALQLEGAELKGTGVHWHVEVTHGTRRCTINCYWYGAAAGLMLGMNAANARVTQRPGYPTRSGPEYLVGFYDDKQRHAGGRAHVLADAVGSVRGWCEGRSIDELAAEFSYVDATRRRLRQVLALIEPACAGTARCVIEQDRLYALWVYGTGRSCALRATADTVAVSFLLGPAQVAFGDVTADPGSPIAAWIGGATVAELAARDISVEPGAELIERGDAAAWHWHHFRERIADPEDVLAELAPLLERLAARPAVTAFFTYSSLNRLCFSASSHYPWVDEGLPVVSPGHPGDIFVDSTKCTVDEAVERIEATLAAYPVRPFFGSAVHRDVEPVTAELAAQGSTLRAELVQQHQWFRVGVSRGDRRCTIGETRVEFRDSGELHVVRDFADRAAAITAVLRWLEARCELRELGEPIRDRVEPD